MIVRTTESRLSGGTGPPLFVSACFSAVSTSQRCTCSPLTVAITAGSTAGTGLTGASTGWPGAAPGATVPGGTVPGATVPGATVPGAAGGAGVAGAVAPGCAAAAPGAL